jgi:hypothetical protein
MMPMMGIKKVISTSRLKMKNMLPIILPSASWTRGKIEFGSQECDKIEIAKRAAVASLKYVETEKLMLYFV